MRVNNLPDNLIDETKYDEKIAAVCDRLLLMLTDKIKSTFKDAAKKLTGSKKRAKLAKVTQDYLDSSPRYAETQLGWSRKARPSVDASRSLLD